MMKNFKWFLGVFAILIAGCYDEGTIAPSEEPELIYGKYTLPQGDHDYDSKIVDIYQKYNSLFLYKFTSKDFGWSVTGNISFDPVRDTLDGMMYKFDAQPADDRYVGHQLNLLEQKFLKYFPEEVKKEMLPQRIFLCGTLDTVWVKKVNNVVTHVRKASNVYPGFFHIAVNWGNEKILTMSGSERNRFKTDVCKAFFKSIYSSGNNNRMGQSDLFFAAGVYDKDITVGKIYENGILNYDHRVSPLDDWLDYIVEIISNPLSELEGEGGILSPAIDVKGVIRKKYEIMLDFFKTEHNIDLQAIGNDVE